MGKCKKVAVIITYLSIRFRSRFRRKGNGEKGNLCLAFLQVLRSSFVGEGWEFVGNSLCGSLFDTIFGYWLYMYAGKCDLFALAACGKTSKKGLKTWALSAFLELLYF